MKISTELFNNCKTVLKVSNPKNGSFDFSLCTDSRHFKKNDAFLPLVGDSFDGHTFITTILKMEPSIVFFETGKIGGELMQENNRVVFVEVSDSLLFLQELATRHVEKWNKLKNKKIIGITGSNGKTTHKEMLKHIMEGLFPGKVLSTQGNLNNHIGVPLTVLKLEPHHEIAIVEMGMNHQGEIRVLCDIAKPSSGLITNIGPAHIEFLKTMENIFLEKSTLYIESCRAEYGAGLFVANYDDDYLKRLHTHKTETKKPLLYFSENETPLPEEAKNTGAILNKVKIDNQAVQISFADETWNFSNPAINEKYNLKNLSGVVLLSFGLFPTSGQDIMKLASNFVMPSMNRSLWLGNIFLDAYNANPGSMRTSLHSFAEYVKNKGESLEECLFVLGDMNELGEFAPSFHKEIGELLQSLNARKVVFVGRYVSFYKKGYLNECSSFADVNELLKTWKNISEHSKYIFIKGSRSVGLEQIVKDQVGTAH